MTKLSLFYTFVLSAFRKISANFYTTVIVSL